MNRHGNITDNRTKVQSTSRVARTALIGCIVMLSLLGESSAARANVTVLHTYSGSLGQEVANLIAVNASKLRPLLPTGYSIVPAASLGIGGPDQGVVVVANFRGIDPTVDDKKPSNQNEVAIDVAILVAEPPEAAEAGVSIPGAFHFYTLAIFTNHAQYFASLQSADMPVELVTGENSPSRCWRKFHEPAEQSAESANEIDYQRAMNDTSGVGTLNVSVPAKDSPFYSFNYSEQGYLPVPGALEAVFWYAGRKGKAMLHFHDAPFRQGSAVSRIYTQPRSTLDILFDGGGLGPCLPDPATNYNCILAPSFNLRYDRGTAGTLLLVDE